VGIYSCGRSKHSDCSFVLPRLSPGGKINDTLEILCDRNEEQCTEKRLTALILLKEEFAVVQAYRQHLSADLRFFVFACI
jgi:hypothetical protein